MKKIVIGILAHVDAGKTTLSESMLYTSGSIRKLGRVDNKDAHLDTYDLEKARGITIFSKQAELKLSQTDITLLDTPGHVDFSAEMERTLQVLDYAVLVISGADGVQGHTQTLWRLLKRYQIPTFLFINKMDQVGTDKEKLLVELRSRLDSNCIDFNNNQRESSFMEQIAMCDENILDYYLEHELVPEDSIKNMIAQRKVFPCYFGSALKIQGVEAFMEGLEIYTKKPIYGKEFGAKVFKIVRDNQGNRLTYLKVTGGKLAVRDIISKQDEKNTTEKITGIRIYSGVNFETVTEVEAGGVCAVMGLANTYPGEGLGVEKASETPVLEPVLHYKITLPEEVNKNEMLLKLRQLEEEEPQLHIVWEENTSEIQAQLMGEVQIEILENLIEERFDVKVIFEQGRIIYKETIINTVEGIGHFEPLRHYAEVHLLMEPLERGSGLQFATDCSEDVLARNWQRLVLTHLEEREHKGVKTGSAITDMKITLIAGKAHLKHTEGGDFRQATYRAIRQGLMQAETRILEPSYDFRLEVPMETVGRAMTDIEKMNGTFQPPEIENGLSILRGQAPVSTMRDYQIDVTSYTGGRGRLTCVSNGYIPAYNEEEVIEKIGYQVELDLLHPTGSVFCAHGAGFVVSWDEVQNYMHLEGRMLTGKLKEEELSMVSLKSPKSMLSPVGSLAEEKELEAIFSRTFGKRKGEENQGRRTYGKSVREQENGVYRNNGRNHIIGNDKFNHGTIMGQSKKQEEYLLVDGYNILFAWEELNEIATVSMDGARGKLMDILCNYQGFKKCKILLVFDAYRVENHQEEIVSYHNIDVVYTKEAETADQYIEKFAHKMGRNKKVTVATSDAVEQIIIQGQGCSLLSARELRDEVEYVNEQIRQELHSKDKGKNYLFDYLPEEMHTVMEGIRLGELAWKDLEKKDK